MKMSVEEPKADVLEVSDDRKAVLFPIGQLLKSRKALLTFVNAVMLIVFWVLETVIASTWPDSMFIFPDDVKVALSALFTFMVQFLVYTIAWEDAKEKGNPAPIVIQDDEGWYE
jgi:hypothetical protein